MAMDSPNVVRISSADQLEVLALEWRRPASLRAEIRLANVATQQVARREAAVNRLLHECGCAWAAKSTTCATLVMAGLGVRGVIAGTLYWPAFIFYGCLSMVGAAVAAKFTAQMIARLRLRRIIAELRELELSAIPSTTMGGQ